MSCQMIGNKVVNTLSQILVGRLGVHVGQAVAAELVEEPLALEVVNDHGDQLGLGRAAPRAGPGPRQRRRLLRGRRRGRRGLGVGGHGGGGAAAAAGGAGRAPGRGCSASSGGADPGSGRGRREEAARGAGGGGGAAAESGAIGAGRALAGPRADAQQSNKQSPPEKKSRKPLPAPAIGSFHKLGLVPESSAAPPCSTPH